MSMIFTIFTTISSLITITSYHFFKNYNNITNTVKIKYDKWLLLNDMVSKKHDSRIMITLISISMILKKFYLEFLQYINNSVVKINKNTYEVSYIINNKLYKMIVKPERGPKSITNILDENEDDITHEIEPYLGPNNDFHGHKFTPKFFCKKNIIIYKHGDEKIIFEDDEMICLK